VARDARADFDDAIEEIQAIVDPYEGLCTEAGWPPITGFPGRQENKRTRIL